MSKKILYVDMDNVLVDFESSFKLLDKKTLRKYRFNLDDIDGIFSLMQPMPDAIESIKKLRKKYDIYILSTAPWNNPSAWSDKLLWIKKHLPKIGYKRLILSHNKNLNKGDFLIDDRKKNGAEKFEGELIHFGTKKFPDWTVVTQYLLEKAKC